MIPLLSSLHSWWGSLCSGHCEHTWVVIERPAVLCSPAGLQQSPPYRWWSWNRRMARCIHAKEALLQMIMHNRTNHQGIPYPWSRSQWNWENQLVFWLFLTDDSVTNNRVSSLWGERRLQPCWWKWTCDPAHHQSHSQQSLILSYCLLCEGFWSITVHHLLFIPAAMATVIICFCVEWQNTKEGRLRKAVIRCYYQRQNSHEENSDEKHDS